MSIFGSLFGKNQHQQTYPHQKLLEYYHALSLAENPDPLLMFNLQGDIIEHNNAVIGNYGKRNTLNEYIHQDDHQKCSSLLNSYCLRGITHHDYLSFCLETKLVKKRVSIYPITVEKKVIGGYLTAKKLDLSNTNEIQLIEKVNEQKRMIQRQDILVNSISNILSDVICITNEIGEINYIAPGFEEILGRSIHERIGKSIFDHVHSSNLVDFQNLIAAVIDNPGNEMKSEILIQHKNGEWNHFEVHAINYLNDSIINGILLNFIEITNRKITEEQIRNITYFHQLTHLPNRRHFIQHLNSLLEKAKKTMQPFAILYLDVDRFKFINESLGQSVGDELLTSITKRIQSVLGKDTFFSHFYSDEFVIIVENDDEEIVTGYASNIIKALERSFTIQAYECFVTVSIGISYFPHSGQTVDTLLKTADIAMSQAKKKENIKIQIYNSELNVGSYKKFMIITDLRKALANNELTLHYQPVINHKLNKIVAVEALIRWRHEVWGEITPGEFIPLAEEIGLIASIGNWVLREACEQNKKWQDSGHNPMAISVNVSAKQFTQPHFVEYVSSVLKESGLAPKYLTLELTESVFISDQHEIVEKLEQLTELGVEIAIDDFGTGYSTFTYLQKFNVDILKIDKSFLHGVTNNSKNKELLATIIDLAKKLNLVAVVEGVETTEQLNICKALNSDCAQGYLFSKPVPNDQFEQILTNGLISVVPKDSKLINKRKFFRVPFEFPMKGTFTIETIRGKAVNVGKTNILIKDISAGGIKLLSNIKIPFQTDLTIRVSTQIGEFNIDQSAKVIWSNKCENDIFEYGLELLIDKLEQKDLLQKLNLVQVKLKNNDLSIVKQFVTTDIKDYFRNL